MAEKLTVTSEQFGDGSEIPLSAAHPSVGGKNQSPQLSWNGTPEGTRSFAISCWDPDAPTTVGFCHWVRFDIPTSRHTMDEGLGTEKGDWTDGLSDFGESHYGGMAPPAGDPAHHYVFTVYALDTEVIGLGDHTTYARFRFAIRDHIVASGSVTGTFAVA
jgi:Raf kinase inhibitor-like YbhB/YbcL family protein